MKLKAYSVFDTAVGAFNQPFFMRSNGEAVRSYRAACAANGPLASTVLDTTLFVVGTWDDASGVLESLRQPERLCTGAEAIAPIADDPRMA